MISTRSTGLALILGAGLAMPATPQQGLEADMDDDGVVTSEEGSTYSEARFDEIAEGGEEITLEQFDAAMQGAEIVGAAEDTEGDVETQWDEADADDSGDLSRDEWMQWRQQRFDEAAGDADQVEAGLYETLYASGMAGVDAGDHSPTEDAPPETGEEPAEAEEERTQ